MINIKITARHLKITNEVKEYLQSKLNTLDRYFDRIKRIEVVLDHSRNLYELEIVVSVVLGKKIVLKTSHYNYIAAIDILVDKIERQLTKFKEIRKARRINGSIREKELARKQEMGGLEQEDWF